MNRPSKHWMFCLIVALAAAAGPSRGLWADTEISLNFPASGQRTPQNNSKLDVRITSRWVDASGYRPVFVELIAFPPASADRTVTIELVANDQRYMGTAEGVRFEMTIGEGQSRVKREVSILQRTPWQMLNLSVTEEGRELKDLQGNLGISRVITNWEWTEAYPSILFIDSDSDKRVPRSPVPASFRTSYNLPDVLAFSSLAPPFGDFSQNAVEEFNRRTEATTDDRTRSVIEQLSTFAIVPFELLPTMRRSYTGIDVIVIDKLDLQRLVEARPEAWSTICEHLATGGNLWVYGMSSRHDDLAVIDAALNDATQTWREPSPDRAGEDLIGLLHRDAVARSFRTRQNGYYQEFETEEQIDDVRSDDDGVPPAELLADPRFVIRDYRMGSVAALGVERLATIAETIVEKRPRNRVASADRISWLLSEMSVDRWRWVRRMGVSLRRPNREFWDFLIPGVGAAPVHAFLGFITGFMILIGPVNYFLLSRARKLYLLLLTVPIGALLFTAGLYSYALVKDGLGTRARLRSFSVVADNGETTSWSRQAYYAGLAPSSGLVYPKTATVFPLVYDPGRANSGHRWMQLGTTQDLYGAGYLRSRETCQTVVVNRVASAATIDVKRSADGTVSATNNMDVAVQHLLVLDEGQPYRCDQLQVGASQAMDATSVEAAREKYLELLTAVRPTKPVGFTPPRLNNNAYYYMSGNCDGSFAIPSLSSGMLERQFGEVTKSLLGNNRSPGRHFLAFLTAAPDYVPLGVPSARQQAGLHVVRGVWQ